MDFSEKFGERGEPAIAPLRLGLQSAQGRTCDVILITRRRHGTTSRQSEVGNLELGRRVSLQRLFHQEIRGGQIPVPNKQYGELQTKRDIF